MTRYIVRLVPERAAWLRPIKAQLRTLEIVPDRSRDAMDTFLRALRHAGDDPAVHMEDDAILCADFRAKAEAVIAARPGFVIQFFSRLAEDSARGSRLMSGQRFAYNLAFYLPAGYSAQLAAYHARWPRRHELLNHYDLMMGDWFAERHEAFWLHVPSLVQHRVARSAIDPRRSSKRQSLTFVP
jgi:hypothetical protein